MKHANHATFMTMDYSFDGIRLINCHLQPVKWHLTIKMISRVAPSIDQTIQLQYQKLNYWLDSVLSNIIITDCTSEDDVMIADISSNSMMYCPGEPTDDLIVKLIHAKMSVLAGEDIIIGDMTLRGDDTLLQYTYNCPESGYSLPDKTDEYYIGEAFSETPWWYRNEGYCFEYEKDADEDDFYDPLQDFYEYVKNNEFKEPAKIVKVDKWIPKKI